MGAEVGGTRGTCYWTNGKDAGRTTGSSVRIAEGE